MFAWKGESLEEYWWCTSQIFDWSAEGFDGPNMILDDGGDATILVHKGREFELAGAVPDAVAGDSHEWRVILDTLRTSLAASSDRWTRIAEQIKGVTEETTTGVHRLYELAKSGELQFAAINVNDSVTKSKFDNKYGIRHSLPDGLNRATDVLIGGKVVFVCGYGDVGKGAAEALKGQGARVIVSEVDPINALQAAMDGFQVTTLESVIGEVDIVVTGTGNKNVVTLDHLLGLKHLAIVANVGHFDDEIDVVNRSVELQQKALDFVNAQHDLGAVSGLNVLQQKAQLSATKTQVELLVNQRQQDEHAIAVLIGKPAPEFALASGVTPLPVPALPTGLPSELLQRRPDVASAERAMAAANAQIGVARSAYFPDITLSPGIGWEATRFATLFSAPSLMWSLGASAGEVLFDGGKRAAGVDFAQAGYESAQATYRQTVLTAFQEVQNAVTGLSVLDRASGEGQAAVDDARQSFELANARYQGGLVAFLDVLTAEQQLLASERQEVQIHGQQVATVVYLAKALGGGWSVDERAAAAGTPDADVKAGTNNIGEAATRDGSLTAALGTH